MESTDKDWRFEENPENLTRYQKDGLDLSDTVNQGQRISDLRNLADVSVQELAEKCNISPQTLLALEAGLQHLEPELAVRMAVQIGVGFSDLWVEKAA